MICNLDDKFCELMYNEKDETFYFNVCCSYVSCQYFRGIGMG